MIHWPKQRWSKGSRFSQYSYLVPSLSCHFSNFLLIGLILSLSFQSMGCPKIPVLFWFHSKASRGPGALVLSGQVAFLRVQDGYQCLVSLCALCPHPLHISSNRCLRVCAPIYVGRTAQRKQLKGNRKQWMRLTCGYGEIPQFCLLVHLAEVCTYFLLSALCPMLHQNPQSQLQGNRERKTSHIWLILQNLLHSQQTQLANGKLADSIRQIQLVSFIRARCQKLWMWGHI